MLFPPLAYDSSSVSLQGHQVPDLNELSHPIYGVILPQTSLGHFYVTVI